MSLKLVIGGSGAGKSTKIYQDIIRQSKEDPQGKFFIIVPDQFTMQTQMDLVTMTEKKGIMNIDVLSFGRLAHRVFEEAGSIDRPMLDDTGKSLIIRKAAAGLKEQMPLLGSSLDKTGYIHEVKSALSEFMQYGIGMEQLKELTEFSKGRGQLHQKLTDLQVIYESYLSYIADRFLTVEETLEVLASLLSSSELIKDSIVVFDGFTGFTPVQNKVIKELLLCTKQVIVTITGDGTEYKKNQRFVQELFALSQKTMDSLKKLAEEAEVLVEKEEVIIPEASPRFLESPALAHLEKQLFKYPAKAYEKNTDDIVLMEASSLYEEVRQICIAMKKLVRNEGYCYRDMALITGDYEAYASTVEKMFQAYEIPVYMDQTRGITLNPFIEYIKSALRIRVQNYSFDAVFHYIRSGLSDFTPEEADRLEHYVRAVGIKGRKKWETIFVYKLPEFSEDGLELEELNLLRERLVAQLKPLYGNYQKTEDFVRALYQFIADNQVQQKLKIFEEKFREDKDAVRAREYAQIYRLVMDLLDQIVQLMGEEPLKFEEFTRILEAGFEEIKVGTIPQNVDRVVVGDMERTRLKQVKVLFVAGVNEGYIPRVSAKGGLLSSLEREYLTGSGLELAPSPRQQVYIQKFYIYLNLTKPSKKLYLSFARLSREGKSLNPSSLTEQIKRNFPELSVNIPENEPVLSKLQTLKDGRDYLAAAIRDYAQGSFGADSEKETEFFSLYSLYKKDDIYSIWTGKLTDTAFFSYEQSPLAKSVAVSLYGQTLLGSVSRLEQFAACAYAHFLRYGLKLKEQGTYTFEAVDLGNIFHGVLELFGSKLKERGYTWFDFPREEGEKMVEEAVDSYASVYGNTILLDNARNEYMLVRIKRILKRTVWAMQYQLKKGAFIPQQAEVSFSVLEELEAVNVALTEEEKLRLRGRIDRIDYCQDEEHVYVKVMDYKSGSRDFSLAALYHGLQLQLVVYMNAALEMAARKYPQKQAVPAAMLYYRVQDPLLEAGEKEMTAEEVNSQILKMLRTTGVVNENSDVVRLLDAELTDKSDVIPVEMKKDGSYSARSSILKEADFRSVSAFVQEKIRYMGREIVEGNIAVNPYVQGTQSACTYCAYKKVCGFDKKIQGYEERKLPSLKEEEVLERIRKEVAESEVYDTAAEGH